MQSNRTQLAPEDHPLVELATRLGYSVYQEDATIDSTGSQHYHITDTQGRTSEGNTLVDALTFMIKRELLTATTPPV